MAFVVNQGIFLVLDLVSSQEQVILLASPQHKKIPFSQQFMAPWLTVEGWWEPQGNPRSPGSRTFGSPTLQHLPPTASSVWS